MEGSEDPRSTVLAVVSGMEHSGTTVLAQSILAHSIGVSAGFECGVLLSESSPADFPAVSPFYDWFLSPVEIGHWGMAEPDLKYACAAPTWIGFYRRIIERCPLFTAGDRFLDKTPAYCYQLENVLARLPDVPVLVTVKDLIVLFASYKRRGVEVETFTRRVERFLKSLEAVNGAGHVYTIQHRDLCNSPETVLRRLSGDVFLDWKTGEDGDWNWSMHPLDRDYDFAVEKARAYGSVSNSEIDILGHLAARYEEVTALHRLR